MFPPLLSASPPTPVASPISKIPSDMAIFIHSTENPQDNLTNPSSAPDPIPSLPPSRSSITKFIPKINENEFVNILSVHSTNRTQNHQELSSSSSYFPSPILSSSSFSDLSRQPHPIHHSHHSSITSSPFITQSNGHRADHQEERKDDGADIAPSTAPLPYSTLSLSHSSLSSASRMGHRSLIPPVSIHNQMISPVHPYPYPYPYPYSLSRIPPPPPSSAATSPLPIPVPPFSSCLILAGDSPSPPLSSRQIDLLSPPASPQIIPITPSPTPRLSFEKETHLSPLTISSPSRRSVLSDQIAQSVTSPLMLATRDENLIREDGGGMDFRGDGISRRESENYYPYSENDHYIPPHPSLGSPSNEVSGGNGTLNDKMFTSLHHHQHTKSEEFVTPIGAPPVLLTEDSLQKHLKLHEEKEKHNNSNNSDRERTPSSSLTNYRPSRHLPPPTPTIPPSFISIRVFLPRLPHNFNDNPIDLSVPPHCQTHQLIHHVLQIYKRENMRDIGKNNPLIVNNNVTSYLLYCADEDGESEEQKDDDMPPLNVTAKVGETQVSVFIMEFKKREEGGEGEDRPLRVNVHVGQSEGRESEKLPAKRESLGSTNSISSHCFPCNWF